MLIKEPDALPSNDFACDTDCSLEYAALMLIPMPSNAPPAFALALVPDVQKKINACTDKAQFNEYSYLSFEPFRGTSLTMTSTLLIPLRSCTWAMLVRTVLPEQCMCCLCTHLARLEVLSCCSTRSKTAERAFFRRR